MTYPYAATIEEKSRRIIGMNADDYLLDSDERLWIQPLKPETFRALVLKKISKLTFTGGKWLLDGENINSRRFEATRKRTDPSGENRTAQYTLSLLHKELKELVNDDRLRVKGVAWFDERHATVDEETAESCALTNEFLADIGDHAKRHPLPQAKQFRLVLLTDFQISPQRAEDMQHAIAYEATIEGQKRKVIGFDSDRNLILANGQRYIFEPLNFNPSGKLSDEPSGGIFDWPLLEVVKLQPWQGDWKWNDEEKLLSQWLTAELEKCGGESQLFGQPTLFKLHWAKSKLDDLLPIIQETVRGVAWFKQGDGMNGFLTPIFLKNFGALATVKHEEAAQSMANHLKNVAADATKQIRTVTSELQATSEQLAEVAQPFREMYKDQRLAGAKADALKVGIPELVVDTVVSFYHSSKLPTIDGLLKYLNNSGFSTKLEAAGHGTSRATVGRWLKEFNKIMQRRGLIQAARPPKTNAKGKPVDNSTESENFAPAGDDSGLTSADTRTQELPEGSEDEQI